MKKFFITAASFIFVWSGASADLLYDIDFSSPLHTVGARMTIDTSGSAPFRTASGVHFGSQVVMNTFEGLTDQPVELIYTEGRNDRRYSQFELDIRSFNYPSYRLDFDVCLKDFNPASQWDEFRILFDTPSVVNLYFKQDGTIRERNNMDNIIGTFASSEVMHISICVDLPNNTWKISKGLDLLYTGQFFYPYPAHPTIPDSIRSIRFNLADDLAYTNVAKGGIDNIAVYGLPEPSAFLLLSLGGLLIRKR